MGAKGRASVIIHNLSGTGLLIETGKKLEPGATFDVDLPEVGATEVRVAWTSGDFYGCDFTTPIAAGRAGAPRLHALDDMAAAPEAVPAFLASPPFGYGTTEQPFPGEQTSSEPKLPMRSRILFVLGISLILWAIIALIFWASFS